MVGYDHMTCWHKEFEFEMKPEMICVIITKEAIMNKHNLVMMTIVIFLT